MRPAFGDRDLVEWNPPRLPRGWTAAGAGVLMARFSRCEPTIKMSLRFSWRARQDSNL